MKVGQVCEVMEELAPAALAYSWDRVGLSTGSPETRVTGILVALSISRETVKAAKRAKANLIVSHHPLIWEPLKNLRSDDPHTALCLEVARVRIACFAAHTNLDVAPGGVNDVLAKKLGLTRTQPLLETPQDAQVKLVAFVPETHLAKVRAATCAAGAGVIGDYTHCSFSAEGVGTFLPGETAAPFSGERHRVNEEPERRFEVILPRARLADVLGALHAAHPYEEVAYDVVVLENRDASIGLGRRGIVEPAIKLGSFARRVRKALRLRHVRIVGSPGSTVRRVGVIGGSGGGEVAHLPGDIDVLVTGDVKYHDAELAHARGIAVIDAGHAGTEQLIVPVVAGYLKKRLEKIPIKTYIEPDYFRVITH